MIKIDWDSLISYVNWYTYRLVMLVFLRKSPMISWTNTISTSRPSTIQLCLEARRNYASHLLLTTQSPWLIHLYDLWSMCGPWITWNSRNPSVRSPANPVANHWNLNSCRPESLFASVPTARTSHFRRRCAFNSICCIRDGI